MTKVDDFIAAARAELGRPYVFGDKGPNSFDCSGLMQYAGAQAGVALPRTADQQQAATQRVSSPLPGDLVFWGDPAYHVALYIGGGKIIAAPEPGDVVKVQDVYGSPTYGRIAGLGTAASGVLDGVTSVASTVAKKTTGDAFGAFAVKIMFGAGGLVIIGLGLTVALKGRAAAQIKEVGDLLT
jgi:hypothetical protein